MSRPTRRSFLQSAFALALAGCAPLQRPPLPRLYGTSRTLADQPPLIVVPGTFGSVLRDRRSGREVWPGSTRNLLLSNYRNLEVEIDPRTLEPRDSGIEADALLENALGRDFYGDVIRTLQEAGGYVRCGPRHRPRVNQRNFYVFLYDFRLDNVRAVRALHELIEQVRRDYGDPRLPVDILAHSNGGLLARYYARYGTAELPDSGPLVPTQAGAAAIRRLLLVGTPNLGTLQPVLSYLNGEDIGLGRIPPEVMVTGNGPTQIMTHPSVPWVIGRDAQPLPLALYDVATWRDNHWSIFAPEVAARTIAHHGGGARGRDYLALLREYFARQLHRGRRFAEALSVVSATADVRPYVFGGDCEPTLSRLVLEHHEGRVLLHEKPGDLVRPVPGVDYEAAMFEPGDTVVTRASLLGRRTLDVAAPRSEGESMQVAHSVFLCERHQTLTGNRSFQDNLLNALLSSDPV